MVGPVCVGEILLDMWHDAPHRPSNGKRRPRREMRVAGNEASFRLVRVRFDPTIRIIKAALLAAVLTSYSEATPRLQIYPGSKALEGNTAAIIDESDTGETVNKCSVYVHVLYKKRGIGF